MTTKEKKRSILGPAGDRSFHLTNLILLSFFFLIVLYPIIYVVSSSFSSAYAVITNKVWLWPVSVTLDGYKACFKQSLLMTGYLNSMLYMIFGTLVNVVLLVLAGYPLSRRDLPGKGMFVLYFTFTMFFSGGMIPNYMLVKNLGLIDNRLAMIIFRPQARAAKALYKPNPPGMGRRIRQIAWSVRASNSMRSAHSRRFRAFRSASPRRSA